MLRILKILIVNQTLWLVFQRLGSLVFWVIFQKLFILSGRGKIVLPKDDFPPVQLTFPFAFVRLSYLMILVKISIKLINISLEHNVLDNINKFHYKIG